MDAPAKMQIYRKTKADADWAWASGRKMLNWRWVRSHVAIIGKFDRPFRLTALLPSSHAPDVA
ncbi:hypothetical protein [Microcoleus sp. herbarium5]|uniref:hypothetical protein n=1 Tax=Microcoleus sp. herbarium5 TaxID=3055434 RepID=UPI002FD70166